MSAGGPRAHRTAPGIGVRAARPADVPAIVAMVDALAAHQSDTRGMFTEAVARRDLFETPRAHAFVAETDGVPAGVAVMSDGAYEPFYAARGAYLSVLWVEPDRRGRGVARALLGAACARVRRGGGTYLWWVSKAWNADAQGAYVRLGAIDDPAHAHAVFGDSFEGLADAADANR